MRLLLEGGLDRHVFLSSRFPSVGVRLCSDWAETGVSTASWDQ